MAALGRVLDRHGDAVDGATVASAWLSALPLVEDRVEARATHAQLVRLVEASDARCALPAAGTLLIMVFGCGCWTSARKQPCMRSKWSLSRRQMQGALLAPGRFRLHLAVP